MNVCLWSHLKLAGVIATMFLLVPFSFAYDTCGDGICGTTESSYNCQLDCPSGTPDSFCDSKEDGICDVDCYGNDPDCNGYKARVPGAGIITPGKADKGFFLKLGLGIFFIILITIIIFVFIRKLKNKPEMQQPMNYQGYQR
ncbi:hypothetical protein JXA85_02760 [Candidatus Woesearchaeota archaeon]|nr:hypothetical protein [Candidatus Woesearchaeota archaeon]